MPLYEYRCGTCGRRFELLQRLGEGASGVACPACGQEDVEREFSTFAGSSSGVGAAKSACSPSGRFT